jgi:amidase
METTSGSVLLIGAKPLEESQVAVNLRKAGAILLGKASMTEWAHARWTNASTGWSPRGGQCTGPFYPRMKAYGSSCGSAVSTALGLTFASIGTEV